MLAVDCAVLMKVFGLFTVRLVSLTLESLSQTWYYKSIHSALLPRQVFSILVKRS